MEGSDSFGGGFKFGSYLEFLAAIGKPAAILWEPAISSVAASFVLGDSDNPGSNYDLNGDGTDESQPFKDETFYITGIRVIAPTAGSASVGKITVDGRVFIVSVIPGGGELHLDGVDLGNESRGGRVADRFGGPIAWRHKMMAYRYSGDQIANSQAWASIKIYGFTVPRFF